MMRGRKSTKLETDVQELIMAHNDLKEMFTKSERERENGVERISTLEKEVTDLKCQIKLIATNGKGQKGQEEGNAQRKKASPASIDLAQTSDNTALDLDQTMPEGTISMDPVVHAEHVQRSSSPASISVAQKTNNNNIMNLHPVQVQQTTPEERISTVRRVHHIANEFKCRTCHASFRTFALLRSHEKTHVRKRPFTCKVCHYWCKGLSAHTELHAIIKRYECTICQKSFKNSDELVRHKRIHTGEKPYKCTTCQKRFRLCSDVIRHIRTHTGEKPHKCGRCKKEFSETGNLRRHERICRAKCHTNL